jgi:hypothetical protein
LLGELQSFDHPFTIYCPFIPENLLTDAIANIPVEQYHFGDYTDSDPATGGLDSDRSSPSNAGETED